MKVIKHTIGHLGRPWHSTDWTTIQNEYLEILEGLFAEPGEASAVVGIDVSGTDVSAGLAVIKHADGWKVVRFAGAVGVSFPYYLEVTKTNTTKLYNDSTSQVAQSNYTASAAAPGGTPPTDTYLKITADGAVRWTDAKGRFETPAWEVLAMAGTNPDYEGSSGDLRIRKIRATNCVHIQGFTDIENIGSAITEAVWAVLDTGIAAQYRPAVDAYFTAMIQYDTVTGTYQSGTTTGDKITMLSGCLTSTGNLALGILQPATLGTALYRVHINAVIPLG